MAFFIGSGGGIPNPLIGPAAATFQFGSSVADGASAVGYEFDTDNALTTLGSKHTTWLTGGTEIGALSVVGSGGRATELVLTGETGFRVLRLSSDFNVGVTFNPPSGGSTNHVSFNSSTDGSFLLESKQINKRSQIKAAELLYSAIAVDSGSFVGHSFDTDNDITTAGGILLEILNKTVEKFSVDKDGDTLIGGDLNHDGSNVGFYGTAPAAQAAAYTRNATIVEDRTLLASASATATNNNNVLAALVADLQAIGLIG